MVKDPVCGMELDEKGFTFRTEYKGHTYHFCRPTCKERFLADPERYIAPLEEPKEEGQDPDRL